MGVPLCLSSAVDEKTEQENVIYGDDSGAVIMLQCGRVDLPARSLKPGDYQVVHDDHTDWVTQVGANLHACVQLTERAYANALCVQTHLVAYFVALACSQSSECMLGILSCMCLPTVNRESKCMCHLMSSCVQAHCKV